MEDNRIWWTVCVLGVCWLLVHIIWYLIYCYLAFHKLNPLKNKVILITGCDTGFGNALAKKLDTMNCVVFATCLNSSTMETLKSETSENVITCIMDVRKMDQIQRCYNLINNYCIEHETYLYGIVNNAGISEFSPFECIPISNFNNVINVNLIGMCNVCRTFIPLMRNGKFNKYIFKNCASNNSKIFGLFNRGKAGRIINISSVAGRCVSPYLTPYATSKHAIVAFSDTLRAEMQQLFNIWVSTVEPFLTHTQLLKNSTNRQDFIQS